MHGAGELNDFHAVLSAHPKVGPMPQAARWVPTLTETDYAESGAESVKRLREHAPTALRITDKMPGNFHYLGFISTRPWSRTCLPAPGH